MEGAVLALVGTTIGLMGVASIVGLLLPAFAEDGRLNQCGKPAAHNVLDADDAGRAPGEADLA